LALPRPPVAGPCVGHLEAIVELHFHPFAVFRLRPVQIAPVVRVAASLACSATGRLLPRFLFDDLREPQMAVGDRHCRYVAAISIQRFQIGARSCERVNRSVVATAGSGMRRRSALELVARVGWVVAVTTKGGKGRVGREVEVLVSYHGVQHWRIQKSDKICE